MSMKNGYELRRNNDPYVLDRLLTAYESSAEDQSFGPISHLLIALLLPLMAFGYGWHAAVFMTALWSAFCAYIMRQHEK